MTRNLGVMPADSEGTGEIDLRAIGGALRRRLGLLVVVAVAACLLIAVIVNVITPRYTAAQILLENQETFFTRPDRTNVQQTDVAQQLDAEAVASQVQLMTSRDIARKAIKQLGLEGNDEFDPKIGAFRRVLILLGLVKDPTQETRDARIVTNFLDKLVVYSPAKTRVIAIEFQSRDPELAARAANTIATLYLKGQSEAKRQTAQDSADALQAQIADLRTRLVKADDDRERYRLQTGLLAGTNNMTITGQQLAEINTDLSKARTLQADAQAKAQMIRDLLRRGQAADVPDVINNDTVRRIAEQRVQVEGQLALESRTLLPGHPRMQALEAQVKEYDRALKGAAKQAATTLENEATIAGARVKNLESVLAQQKTAAGTSNADEVHLRALDRAADSLKEQLESSTTKYQEALARASSDATPADARIIQSAVPPQEPSFPKKLPFIAFGTLAVLALAVGIIVAGELIGGPAPAYAAPQAQVEEEERHETPAPASFAWEEPAPRLRRTRRVTTPAVTTPAVTEDDDVVFAPAPAATTRRPSALKDLLAGGLIAAIVERVRAFGRSADDSRVGDEAVDDRFASSDGVGWEAAPKGAADRTGADLAPAAAAQPVDIAPTVDRIVAAHVPGRGLHVVGAGIAAENPGVLIALARALAERGRTVIVDLDRSPGKLAPLARSGAEGGDAIASLTGLSELLGGNASFAEVIHRDHASRLHFIPTGRLEADFRDFDLILDALTATYDFIVMLAPAYPQSEIAKIMAPYADFVVLAPLAGSDDGALGRIERELADAGAREVLIAGRVAKGAHQDVA
ncbi:Lipopolysaccharide biosynthesis protein [Beijerinckiaceae bacterium RH AL1]|nr:Lipopolysaccharide biosynthesis protein [Beijerinckiaceae bacterium RH AL1]